MHGARQAVTQHGFVHHGADAQLVTPLQLLAPLCRAEQHEDPLWRCTTFAGHVNQVERIKISQPVRNDDQSERLLNVLRVLEGLEGGKSFRGNFDWKTHALQQHALRCREGRHSLGSASLLESAGADAIDTVKWKVLPAPTSLSTQIRPPIMRTSSEQMDRPSPVPPYFRVVEPQSRSEPACETGSRS